jgi:two-component system alkaline phosphatase synthesis response regulator PhoP
MEHGKGNTKVLFFGGEMQDYSILIIHFLGEFLYIQSTMADKILVVEDDSNIEQLVTFKLKNSGYEVFNAHNGQEALDFLKKNSVDLIVTDVMMPIMGGKELVMELKKNPKTRSIPTVMLTSRTLEKEIVEGFELGVEDYIKKPFSPQELIVRIKTVLARSKS